MTFRQASNEISTILDREPTKGLPNLWNLEFVSSIGLRILLHRAKVLKSQEGVLKICGVKGMVKEVMDISGFDTVLQLHDKEPENEQPCRNDQG